MIAPWLKNHLIDTGRWNHDGTTRQARLRTHTCGATVLTGLDADTCAIPTTCDPQPLTTTGEMLALLGNKPTYDLWVTSQQLDGPRRPAAITNRPATNTGSTRVLATHVCGTPPLPAHDTPPAPTKEATDACPF